MLIVVQLLFNGAEVTLAALDTVADDSDADWKTTVEK